MEWRPWDAGPWKAAWMNCGWRVWPTKSEWYRQWDFGGRRVKEDVRNALGGGNTCGQENIRASGIMHPAGGADR